MNRKAEGVMQSETIRSVAIIPIIILVFWFFTQILGINQPNLAKTFNDVVDTTEKAKDNEPFIRNININDHFIYGFNMGSEYIGLGDGKKVAKPDLPVCNAGACICLCKEDCKSKEETYCKSISGVNSFVAYGYQGVNKGAGYEGGQYLALDGRGKTKIVCAEIKRSAGMLSFTQCGMVTA